MVMYEHEKVQLPKNLILMGDIIADSSMSRDHEHEHQVKVGFFNNSHEAVSFDEFKKNFDIIITGDGTLCPIVVAVAELFGT